MRILYVAIPFALLAACSGGGEDKTADTNAAAPEAAVNASTSAANTMAAMDPVRAAEVQECADDVRPEVPAGTDIDAFCNCAVDRMRGTGSGEREAMDACAAQMGIRPNN